MRSTRRRPRRRWRPAAAWLVVLLCAAALSLATGSATAVVQAVGTQARWAAAEPCPSVDAGEGCVSSSGALVTDTDDVRRRRVEADVTVLPDGTQAQEVELEVPQQPGRDRLEEEARVELVAIGTEVVRIRTDDGMVLRTDRDPLWRAAMQTAVAGFTSGAALFWLTDVPRRRREAGWFGRPAQGLGPGVLRRRAGAACGALLGLSAGVLPLWVGAPPGLALATSVVAAAALATALLRSGHGRPTARPDVSGGNRVLPMMWLRRDAPH